MASLSNPASSWASQRTLRAWYSRAACSRAVCPFSADRCLSISHSTHVVRRASNSSGALSAVAFPGSSSRCSRRAATPTVRPRLECCSGSFLVLSFPRFSRAASNSASSSFSLPLPPICHPHWRGQMQMRHYRGSHEHRIILIAVLVAFVLHHLGYEPTTVTWV